MLTVSIVDKYGNEMVYEAHFVECNLKEGLDIYRPGEITTHLAASEDSENFRNAYVMNDQGKTVARYLF